MMAHRQGLNAPQRQSTPAVMQIRRAAYTIFVIKKACFQMLEQPLARHFGQGHYFLPKYLNFVKKFMSTSGERRAIISVI